MKWGLICPICDRLLWTRLEKFQPGESLLSKGVRHAETGEFAGTSSSVYWCGCKPSTPPKQQDLASAR